MNVPLKLLTAEEFVDWAMTQELGRFELIDGVVVPMNSETSRHARVKLRIAVALQDGLDKAGLRGDVFGDGMSIKIADRTVHEPDASLRLGEPLDDKVTIVTDPVIVVEVLSPRSGPIDTGIKLVNYFKLPTVRHYLVVNTIENSVLHYSRGEDGKPAMSVIEHGSIQFSGLNFSIDVDDILR